MKRFPRTRKTSAKLSESIVHQLTHVRAHGGCSWSGSSGTQRGQPRLKLCCTHSLADAIGPQNLREEFSSCISPKAL